MCNKLHVTYLMLLVRLHRWTIFSCESKSVEATPFLQLLFDCPVDHSACCLYIGFKKLKIGFTYGI